jgi:dUTP pyrophosphatase
MFLEYFKVSPNIPDPNFQTRMAACFDLAAYIPSTEKVKIYDGKKENLFFPDHDGEKGSYITLMPSERALVRTGLTFNVPQGYSVRIHPRSGMALKYGLTLANCEGVVDEDYTYETKLIMINTSTDPVRIYDRDRIAQGELVKNLDYTIEECYTAPMQKTNRVGGFGSTGIGS